MLESTFELIGLAASNSHMIFCLFNIIIAILVVGSSKSSHQNHKLTSAVTDSSGDQNAVSSLSDTLVKDARADEGGEDEDDEDLKRRVEEFIQKVNKGWREDREKTFSLDQ